MSKVFLSYQRTGAHPEVARVVEALKQAHGPQSFVDAPPIRAVGSAYRILVENAMRECVGTTVIAGPEINTPPDALGRHRLDNPDDPLRIELESALKIHKFMVVIALVGGARLPPTKAMPASLRPYLQRGAVSIGAAETFETDIRNLSAATGHMLSGIAQRSRRIFVILLIAVMMVSLLLGILASVAANTGGL